MKSGIQFTTSRSRFDVVVVVVVGGLAAADVVVVHGIVTNFVYNLFPLAVSDLISIFKSRATVTKDNLFRSTHD